MKVNDKIQVSWNDKRFPRNEHLDPENDIEINGNEFNWIRSHTKMMGRKREHVGAEENSNKKKGYKDFNFKAFLESQTLCCSPKLTIIV